MKYFFSRLFSFFRKSAPVTPEPTQAYTVPAPEDVKASSETLEVPTLNLPSNADSVMIEARLLFTAYANSEEFFVFVRLNAHRLSNGNDLDLEDCISKFKTKLSGLKSVTIAWGSYAYFSRAIGGWDDYAKVIYQNSRIKLTERERAAHWLHEVSHACGFTHEVNGQLENNISAHPEIQNSFPYQLGNLFEGFLNSKGSL